MFGDVLSRLGVTPLNSGVYAGRWIDHPVGEGLTSLNPATGQPLARVVGADQASYDAATDAAAAAFLKWRLVPPPQRGEVVRQIGLALRESKVDLGMLVT